MNISTRWTQSSHQPPPSLKETTNAKNTSVAPVLTKSPNTNQCAHAHTGTSKGGPLLSARATHTPCLASCRELHHTTQAAETSSLVCHQDATLMVMHTRAMHLNACRAKGLPCMLAARRRACVSAAHNYQLMTNRTQPAANRDTLTSAPCGSNHTHARGCDGNLTHTDNPA